jgi:hypothetical protein
MFVHCGRLDQSACLDFSVIRRAMVGTDTFRAGSLYPADPCGCSVLLCQRQISITAYGSVDRFRLIEDPLWFG